MMTIRRIGQLLLGAGILLSNRFAWRKALTQAARA
jgi:hypothetical protein